MLKNNDSFFLRASNISLASAAITDYQKKSHFFSPGGGSREGESAPGAERSITVVPTAVTCHLLSVFTYSFLLLRKHLRGYQGLPDVTQGVLAHGGGGGGCRRDGGGVEPGHNILQMNEVIRTDTTIYIVVRPPRVFGTEAGVAISKLSALIQADSGWPRPESLRHLSPTPSLVLADGLLLHPPPLFSPINRPKHSPRYHRGVYKPSGLPSEKHLLSVSPLILVRPFRCADTIIPSQQSPSPSNSPRLPSLHRWSGRWGRSRI